MLPSKLKHVSRKRHQIAALEFPKKNWNLTQQLDKSHSDQLRNELHWLLAICVCAGSVPIGVFPRFRGSVSAAVQYCWLIALYAWLCTAAYWELKHSTTYVSDLEQKFFSIESITYLIHVPCIMVLSMRWRHRLSGVFDSIAQFDMACGYVIETGSIRRCVRYVLLGTLICTVGYIPMGFCYMKYDVMKAFFDMSTYLLPNILIILSIIPYFLVFQGIYSRLKFLTLNLQLELRRGMFVQRAAIQQIRLHHVNLLHFIKEVNQAYGVSILCVYVSSFFNVNTNLFLAYKNIENPDPEDWAWWADILFYLFINLGKMFTILYCNHSVQQEQANCLTLLSKIQTQNEALIRTVNHFMLQLQIDVRAYVACSLIVLDYKFITTLMMIICFYSFCNMVLRIRHCCRRPTIPKYKMARSYSIDSV